MAGEERTEQATPRRRQEARRRGQVARSAELSSIAVLMSLLIALRFWGPHAWEMMQGGLADALTQIPQDIGNETLIGDLTSTLLALGRIMGPFFVATLFGALAINYLQVGILFTSHPLIPDLNRINPVTGASRLFSVRALVELFKSLLKLGIVGWIAYATLKNGYALIVQAPAMSPGGLIGGVGGLLLQLGWRCAIALLVLAALDYGYQRYDYEKNLRMTREEVRQEYKQMEGDPTVRARIRQRQREMARSRMMQEVPRADVVITNPTTYAVAVRYDAEEMSAPTVVAKGQRLIAERIREIAVANRVPIVENKPLARQLFRTVEVGQEVPSQFYQAVAEVLAFVYQLNRQRGQAIRAGSR